MKKIFTLFTAILFVGSVLASDLLSIDFTRGQGDWTINDVNKDTLSFVWQQSNQYGMKASAYFNNANHTTESWLVSPVIDLSNAETCKLAFSHARRFGSLEQLRVIATASTDSTSGWVTLDVSAWPDGKSWNYIDAEADLSAFAGKADVQVAFVYTSDSTGAATWEIKTVSVSDGELIPIVEPDVVFEGKEFAGQGTASTGSPVSLMKDSVTFSCTKAYGDSVYGSLRCYKNGVVSIVSTDQQIGKLVFQFPTVSGTYYNGGLPDEVIVNGQEWSATLASQARFDKISVFFGEYEEKKIDTLSVAQAIEIANALIGGQTTAEKYYIEGFAVNVAAMNTQYMDQDFFLVDDASQPDTILQAFRATPKKDDKAYPVLAGDKLRLFGALRKYVKDSVAQLEIMNPTVEFLEEVEGDRTIEEPTEQMDTITVARALEIGKALSSGAVSAEKYVFDGYVSSIIENYSEQYGNETFWITDSLGSRAASSAAGAFEVYRGKPNTGAEIGIDAKIRIACKIKNYNGTVENDGVNIVFEVLEQGHEETFDTITVARALEIGDALENDGVTPVKYVIEGYVSSIESYFDTIYKNETFWISDIKGSHAASNADSAFYVFRGTPTPAEEIGWNAKVYVTSVIKKYMKNGVGIIETNGKVDVNVVEKGEEETIESISVAQALEIGLALADQGVTEQRYEITGYVSSIDSYFDPNYKNETFWITDSLGSRASSTADGAFEIYRGKPNTEQEIGLNAKIKIICKIKNFRGTIENDGTGILFEVLEQGQELKFDTITVTQAMEIGMALEDNATTDVDYVVNGYVVKAYEPDSGYTNQNFYMADYLDEYGEFYAYRCTPEKQVVAGDFLYVLGKIQKYVKGDRVTIELSYGTATHGDVPPIDTIIVDVRKAVEVGMQLAADTKTTEYYLVTGYVANITSEFDEEEKNESFWMTDEEDAVEGQFYANLARLVEPGAGEHQRVGVFGRIQHYVDEEGVSIIRIDKGSAKLLNDEGIENVMLTEQATKVMMDGVLYIIRDNKMYTIQGARVR